MPELGNLGSTYHLVLSVAGMTVSKTNHFLLGLDAPARRYHQEVRVLIRQDAG